MAILSIRVKPNARKQVIQTEPDGSLTIYLKSPPVHGKANEELMALLAKTYQVPKSAIRIKSGASAKIKRVEIDRTFSRLGGTANNFLIP